MARTIHGLPGVYNSSPLTLEDGAGAAIALNSKGEIISAVGVGSTDLGKEEDAAHTSGDTGIMALAVRNDALAALAGTDGDYASLQVSATGALFVEPTASVGTTVVHHAAVRLDDSPTTATSSAHDITNYANAKIAVTIDSTLVPTTLTLEVQGSWDDTTYYSLEDAPLMWWEDTGTATAVNEVYTLKNIGFKYIKTVITAVGSDATNYFDVTVNVTPFN